MDGSSGDAAPRGAWAQGYASGHHGSQRSGHQKRRKGFLGELFD